MKVLMFSSDNSILTSNSKWRQRFAGNFVVPAVTVLVATSKRNLEKRIDDGNLTIIPVQNNLKIIIFFKFIFYGLCIGSEFKKEGKVVITSQDPFFLGFISWLVSSVLNVKLELQVHTDVFSRGFYQFSISNKIKYHLAKFLLPKADLVRVVSKKIKNSLFQIVEPGKIFILPVIFDVNEKFINNPLPISWPSDGKKILMVGRMVKEKRYDLALAAFKIVSRNRRGLYLCLIGDGPERENIKKIIVKFHLQSQVILFGWQSNPETFYQSADIFLHTSAYEGYGLVLAEAALFELPIVSTDVGIARDIGAVIASENAEDLAQKIETVLDKPKIPSRPVPIISTKEYFEIVNQKWQII